MENIVENNKLIAEFMGAKPSDRYADGTTFVYTKESLPTPHSSYHWDLGSMEYDIRWDWLMPVVEKIDNIGFDVCISRISCKIHPILEPEKTITSLVCGDTSKKLELVYGCVIEFIKWYNRKRLTSHIGNNK